MSYAGDDATSVLMMQEDYYYLRDDVPHEKRQLGMSHFASSHAARRLMKESDAP